MPSNSSMDLLGKNPVQWTLSFIKSIHKQSLRNNATAYGYYPILVPSYALFHTFSAQLLSSNCCSTGGNSCHFASAIPCIFHFHPKVVCGYLLSRWQVLTQLFWGIHKPGSARELTLHGDRLHQRELWATDKYSLLFISGRQLYLASQKVAIGVHLCCSYWWLGQ